MTELWQQLASGAMFGDFSLLRNVAESLPREEFAVAFSAAVERAYQERLLTDAGRQLLLEFGAGCGRYDVARQEQHIAYYRDRVEELEETLRCQAQSKSRVYRVLGPAGAGALILLLL